MQERDRGFPARLITTRLSRQDLVLSPQVLQEIDAIGTWIHHAHASMGESGLGRAPKPGYRSLFYGPPGTGKTLAATVLGQLTGADVYRIDLAVVVSKYIGETEKKLTEILDQARIGRWILYFDGADVLLDKRAAARNAPDHYANADASDLLQRMEDFPGTVILASTLKDNIDTAFTRRFHSIIYFAMPDARLRRRLWEGMFSDNCRLAADVNLDVLAEKYELSGGSIANVVHNAAISALQANRDAICSADLLNGVLKEQRKECKTV